MKKRLLTAACLLLAGFAGAKEPLTLRQALDSAAGSNPALLASRQRWIEKERGIALTSGWPNPSFGVMADDIPQGGGKPMMFEYSLSQEIMFPAKLAAMRKMAKSEAGMAGADFEAKQMALYTAVKRAYYDLLYAQRGLAIMRENLELMRQFNAVAEANYRSGAAALQDALRSQTELAKMETEIANMEAMEGVARNKLNYLLGRGADEPLAIQEEFSNAGPEFDLETARRLSQNNPAIQSMTRELEMARANLAMAKAAFWPDFKMEMGGSYSLDMQKTMKKSWKAGVMVMLPLWFGQYKAKLNAANAGAAAAQAALADMRNMAGMELAMAQAEVRSAFRLERLYEKTVIPQTEQTWQTAITAYQNGRADFMSVMDALTSLRAARLDYFKARIDYEKALADLEEVIGRPFFAAAGSRE